MIAHPAWRKQYSAADTILSPYCGPLTSDTQCGHCRASKAKVKSIKLRRDTVMLCERCWQKWLKEERRR